MAYTKYPWKAGKTTPINATNLNHIEDGIHDAHELHRDLISGVTPTYSGWTVDPTDGADITDGNISTICTTGNKVAGSGWQSAIFEWDLGATYNVFVTAVGGIGVTAGNPRSNLWLYDGSSWIAATGDVFAWSGDLKVGTVYGGVCSKVRLGITSDAAATITPNIRECHVWRLG